MIHISTTNVVAADRLYSQAASSQADGSEDVEVCNALQTIMCFDVCIEFCNVDPPFNEMRHDDFACWPCMHQH